MGFKNHATSYGNAAGGGNEARDGATAPRQ